MTELRQDRGLYDVFAGSRRGGARPGRGPAAREDARGLPRGGRRPGRRDPGPAGRDQRAAHDAGPGVQPQHPRRRPQRAGHARPAGRDAAGLARRPPGRRRRPGHGDAPTTPTRCRRGCSSTTATSARDVAVGVPRARLAAERAAAAEMFDLRHEYANLVGFDDWASYDVDVKMIGSGPAIPEFIDKIADAAEEPMRRDLAVLLERLRKDVPGAAEVTSTPPTRRTTRSWSARSSTTSTPSWCAPTSTSTKVRQGLLDVTGRLFGLRYDAVPDAPVWHEDVTAYDVFSTARCRLGRLDGRPARADLPRPAPARGQVQARRAVHDRQRRGRPAAARGRAGVQLRRAG